MFTTPVPAIFRDAHTRPLRYPADDLRRRLVRDAVTPRVNR
jgi:hypothetical protein